jgi:hypothetical protein
MKKTAPGKHISVRTTTQKLTSTKTRGRLVTLFVLAFLAVAVAVSSLSLAQTTKESKRETPLKTESKLFRAQRMPTEKKTQGPATKKPRGEASAETASQQPNDETVKVDRNPKEFHLSKAHEFKGDLRDLPPTPPIKMERPEREAPGEDELFVGGSPAPIGSGMPSGVTAAAAAPTPLSTFEGLDFATWGGGHPPDTNGDVGPTYYIETVNTSIGIYNKSTGVRVAAFTFNTFMSQGHFGNLCDTNNFGDPVVVYDSFEDRWIITDFAFTLDGSSNVNNPPGSFQCFAASKSGDPVSGGWNYYSINTAGGLGDYPKFGIWPDGLYMTVNMFPYAAGGSFLNPRVYAFNKLQMYAGIASPQVISFDAPAAEFTILPANARLQTGTPPLGSPNYYSVVWQFTNAVSVYKFHVDWNSISTSTFTGPFTSIAPSSWASPPSNVPEQSGNNIDTLALRTMVQNQYTNLSGVESVWTNHTVQGSSASQSAVRYYQVGVTGGTVGANTTQAATWNPDATNRFMPSLAVDRAGNMALGYSASSAALFPAIRYAGRLSTDPVSTLPLTETSLIEGTGSQSGSCGSSTCIRWGDYSAMTLDPNGCTFWYTNEYYQVTGLNDNTRIGSLQFSPCTALGNGGTLQGTVTDSGSTPINGATVTFGSRTTTTNPSGFYAFAAIPSGIYPSESASNPGFNPSTANNLAVADAMTTTQNFTLTTAPASSCPVDTTQADFQTGVPTNVDLTTSPGGVILMNAPTIDQQNKTVTNNGFAFSTTSWAGQTFTPAVTGQLTRVDIDLFCSGCSGTTPNITVSIRATTGSPAVPTGADLATATITGFSSGAGGYFTVNFGSPATLTAGTTYAIVFRAVSNPSAGTYAYVCSCSADTNPYANGQRVTSLDSGSTWTADVTSGGRDIGFVAYMEVGFAASGNQVSSEKDGNPATSMYTHWATMSWTATVPANTTLKFQAAASNSASGPFNFVGPDGTAATFFTTSPANITEFNGNRYLRYKAFLTTTDTTKTPTLNDVTVCFNNTAAPTAAPASISGSATGQNGVPLAGVTMRLSGSTSAVAITDGKGAYSFSGIDSGNFYSVTPSLVNYHFSPANRSFSLLANQTDAVFTGTPDASVSANAIDTPEYFVRQQYVDFLAREPDQNGFDYWDSQLLSCNGDAGCVSGKRIDVSAAFFMSPESQDTGSFVYGLYAGTLGRTPMFAEFTPDRAAVIGGANLDAAKVAFADSFVQRPKFAAKYPQTMTRDQFVDALLQTMNARSGVDLSSLRGTLISDYDSGVTQSQSRSLVVRDAVQASAFAQAEYNKAFVLTEYFAYLRRDPEAGGYNFWLNALNSAPSNYRGMVCSFITSAEYQRRFGAVITHSNAECGP